MSEHRNWLASLALSAAAVLSLAVSACSSSSAGPAPAAPTPSAAPVSSSPSAAVPQPAGVPSPSPAAGADAGGGPLTTVTMVMTYPQGTHAPIYWGVQNGVFKQHGIDLQIQAPSSAQATTDITYVNQGQFDVGYVGPFELPVYKAQNGDDVVAFFGWTQHNPACLIVRADSAINSVSDLSGKTIAINSGSGTEQVYNMLEHYGVSRNSVQVQEVSPSTTAGLLIAGQVDAVEQYASATVPLLQAQGIQTRSFCLDDAGLDYEATGFATTRTYLNAHPQAIQGVTLALIDVFNEAQAHPDVVAQAFAQQFGATAGSPDVIQAEVEQTFPFMQTANSQGHPWGWMAEQDWAQTLQYDETYLQTPPGMDPSSFYTDEFFPQS